MNKKIPTTLGITMVALLASIVAGIAVWQYYLLPKDELKISEVEVLEDETKDWKTFVNEKYGYEIKYPEEGSFVLTPKGPDGEGADGYMVDFTWEGFNARITAIENSRNDKTIDELKKKTKDFDGIENVTMVNIPDSAEEILVDNTKGYKLVFISKDEREERRGAYVILFNGGEYFYEIKFSCFQQEADGPCLPRFEEKEEDFDLFVSSFEFLK